MAGRDGRDYLTEEQASALWRRAAQLQAEASERQDDETRQLAAGEPVDEAAIHVSDVETAGAEAGISPEFIRLARAETIADGSRPMSPRFERLADRFLGERRVIEVTRTIDAPPSEVLEIVGRVFPANPYYLNLIETLGEPATGGVLVFEVTARSGNVTSFGWNMMIADIKQVLIMLQPADDAGETTSLVLVASLNYARKLNLGVGGVLTGLAGAGGFAIGGAIGAGALGLGALAVLPAAAGVAALAGLSTVAYRPMYRWGLGRGQRALEGLVRAVDLRIRAGDLVSRIPRAGESD